MLASFEQAFTFLLRYTIYIGLLYYVLLLFYYFYAQNDKQPFWENALGDYRVIITPSAANQR